MFSRCQAQILEALATVPLRAWSVAELVDVLYGDRDDGGPLTAELVVKRQIFTIRRKIARHDLPVRVAGGRGYRLEPLLPPR